MPAFSMFAGLHSEVAKVAHVVVARVVGLLPFRQIEIDLVGYAGVLVVLDAVEAKHDPLLPTHFGGLFACGPRRRLRLNHLGRCGGRCCKFDRNPSRFSTQLCHLPFSPSSGGSDESRFFRIAVGHG